jgi:hypothetical protein
MKTLCILAVCFSISTCLNAQTFRLRDSSDWWSISSEKYSGLIVTPLRKQFDTRNFKILGLSLDTVELDAVVAKLGKAAVVDRGDASTGRSQICYASNASSEQIHLVFEASEGQSSTFYLFSGGADWNGSNRCVKSSNVTARLSTDTGLRLGLSRMQVEAILGTPDSVKGDRIAYWRQFYRKATKEEFERSRREYPEYLSDELAHQKFDQVPVTMLIEVKFNNLQSNYIVVSTDSLKDN